MLVEPRWAAFGVAYSSGFLMMLFSLFCGGFRFPANGLWRVSSIEPSVCG